MLMNNRRTPISQAVHCALFASMAAGAGLTATAANAQEEAILEEVVVTGSRLLRERDFVAISPVQTVGADRIGATGNLTLEMTLNQYPQLKPDQTGTTAQSNPTGVLTADLRGLSGVRTLVLVDGRRFVPAHVTGLVDLATIPDALVERVEIVTGGASAVYGSDAIAGAVNFVMRSDFEGMDIRYQNGVTDRNDGASEKVDLTLGMNAPDGRGNMVLNASYSKLEPVYMGDREFSRIPTLADSTGALQPFGVGTIPGALIGVPSTDFGLINGLDLTNSDGSCPGPIQGIRFGDNSVPAPFCRPVDQYNYAPPNYLLRPLERWQIAGLGSAALSDRVEGYAQIFYTNKENAYQQAPDASYPTSFGQERGTLLVPQAATNPLFTQPLRDFFAANAAYFDPDGDGTYAIRNTAWQIEQLGPRNVTTVTDGYLLTGGFRGDVDFGANTWNWDAFYQYSKTDLNFIQANRLSRSRLDLGLDIVVENNEVKCRVQLLGCIPVAVFGTDALTEEMSEYLKLTTGRQDQFTREVVGASITGDLFELPAGPVATAFGYEYRAEDFRTIPDETQLSGDLGTRPPVVNGGEFDITEVFGEARFPLLSDASFAESLAVEAAARFADYSTIGSVTAWNGALDWQVNESVRIRSGISRAIRAPNLNEYFGAPTTRFSGGVDPCVADNNPTDAQKQLCVAQGVPQAIVDLLQVGASQGYTVRSGGNEELLEEESDTFTAGLVYTPERWPNLSMSLDYYDISVEGAITEVSAQALVDSCFETLDANGAPCRSITRLTSGNIDQVDAPLLNVATRQVRGIDLQVVSTIELPEWASVTQGGADLGLTFVASNQFDDTTQLLPDAPEVNCAGYYGGTCSSDGTRITPDFRMLVIAAWNSGPANVNLQFNYIGDLDLSENAFPNENGTLDSMLYVDLNGGVAIGDRFRVFGGIRNLMDKQPPVTGYRAGGDASTNVILFDPIGRQYFIGASASFGE